MSRARVLRRVLAGVAATLAVVLVVLAVTAAVLVRRPFPDTDASLQLPGLQGEVTVLRGERGVPQVYAGSATDLFTAQGFVHAQDRFFEMDVRRHVSAGRLSELVGADPDALAADKAIRTMGWRRVAEQELRLLQPETRAYLQAYADGVNAYLSGRSPGELSASYSALDAVGVLPRIEPWTPVDSLSWLKAMAWELRSNYGEELTRAEVFGRVGDLNRVEQLFPPYPYDRHTPIVPTLGALEQLAAPLRPAERLDEAAAPAPVAPEAPDQDAAPAPAADGQVVEDADARASLAAASRLLESVPSLLGSGEGLGSNAWAVAGEHTESGLPLLANDPHLAPSVPGPWYQIGLHCRPRSQACPFDVAGATLSGVPGVVIGHNDRVAWGLANLAPDVTDFFLERTTDDVYLRDGQQEPLEVRQELIEVAGGDPVPLTVRSSVHGPILSDVLEPVERVGRAAPVPADAPFLGTGYDVALAWTALTPGRTADAIFALNAATGWEDFREAARAFEVPAQNLVYADVEGNIGYQATGTVPVRGGPRDQVPALLDGRYPRPGWDSRFDWQGTVPFEQLPSVLNPQEGFVVAANQAVTGPAWPVLLTRDWDPGYRAERIRELLSQAVADGGSVSVQDMARIQLDDQHGFAPVLVPYLRNVALQDDFTEEARSLLRGWDYSHDVDSAPAAYYNAVWSSLLRLTFHDELIHPETQPAGGARWYEVVRTLLEEPSSTWWDDQLTPNIVETRDEILRQALIDARLELTRTLGKDPSGWRWGELHRLQLRHRPLGAQASPQPLRALVNPDPVGVPGGAGMVNATVWDARPHETYQVIAVPSIRMVVDLSDLDRSAWTNLTGISGHPTHEHYLDQFDAWVDGELYPWPFSDEAVCAAAQEELVLSPAAFPPD